MISQISGILRQKRPTSILVDVNRICYEVLLPGIIMKKIAGQVPLNGSITLATYHYYQSDPSRSTPVLIGFMNEIEKEFFEKFITVTGVGPKAACKALELPLSKIADAIDTGDIALLKSLPGIGEQRARLIIAKLQGRIGKYGLIQDKAGSEGPSAANENLKEEALQILTKLQYSKNEAQSMIEKAVRNDPNISSCEELLNEVYKQKNPR